MPEKNRPTGRTPLEEEAAVTAPITAPAEELLKTIVRNVPVVLFALDREGIFTFSDGKGLEALDLQPGEAVGQSVFDIFARYDVLLTQIRRALAGEIIAWSAEVNGMAYEVRCSLQQGLDGTIEGLIGVAYDVTDRRRAETELRRALAREERIARTLQRPLALHIPPDLQPGLELASRYKAALDEAAVGGDFFDVFTLSGGRVALVIADASGKGLVAAARAIQVREVLRAFARAEPNDPAGVLAHLNDYLCDARDYGDEEDAGAFIALSLLVLDPVTGEGIAVVAGAEPPLLICTARRGAGGSTSAGTDYQAVDGCSGLPLGVERGEIYQAVPVSLLPGDVLLFFTDGIAEAHPGRSNTGDSLPLGQAGIAELARNILKSKSDITLDAVADAVLEGARTYARGAFRDDACLLLVRKI